VAKSAIFCDLIKIYLYVCMYNINIYYTYLYMYICIYIYLIYMYILRHRSPISPRTKLIVGCGLWSGRAIRPAHFCPQQGNILNKYIYIYIHILINIYLYVKKYLNIFIRNYLAKRFYACSPLVGGPLRHATHPSPHWAITYPRRPIGSNNIEKITCIYI